MENIEIISNLNLWLKIQIRIAIFYLLFEVWLFNDNKKPQTNDWLVSSQNDYFSLNNPGQMWSNRDISSNIFILPENYLNYFQKFKNSRNQLITLSPDQYSFLRMTNALNSKDRQSSSNLLGHKIFSNVNGIF